MVQEEKIQKVKNVKKLIESHTVIGLVDMYKMPSKQLQQIKKELRGEAVIKMTKKTILNHALEELDNGNIKKIEDFYPRQPALILSDKGPFKLYKLVKNLKFKTTAKPGDVPDENIWVHAGPTNLMAGPAISEFKKVKLPATIEGGKIVLRKDKLFIKSGEEIDTSQADILRKLDIEPIDVTLNIVSIYKDGMIYEESVLKLVLEYPGMLPAAFQKSINLSVNIDYPTKENINYILSKASMKANALKKVVKKEDVAEEEDEKKVSSETAEKTEEKKTETQEEDNLKEENSNNEEV